ncbi:cobalt ECF transporter T component CbiQ [Vallicoccus soli]|uniref:Cobalt ECF transporter T component CbiQ n=1 Tax=Vallicoccus soli TaxID=2339232 RepID=A0A3A3Z1Z8_9ACTN|nr:cobalt ECF transporter T component CbiQ [Vallicoccus soli]
MSALPAHLAVPALLGFVAVVVATPWSLAPAFAGYAALLVAVAVLARVRPAALLRRMLVEVPFVVFALLLPFVATGPRTEVLGVAVSSSGLAAAGALLAKGTLGVAASVLLALTTPPRELLLGLRRLRVPPLLVEIASFMVRYGDVVLAEMRRMRVARASRGFQARHLGHAPVLARSAGALFVRSYERGERVHLAMLSRGWTGSMPVLDEAPTRRADALRAALLPAGALAVLLATALATTLA